MKHLNILPIRMKINSWRKKFVVVLVALCSSVLALAADDFAALSVAKRAALREDWQTVAKTCEEAPDLSLSPPLRALMGHACLWLNRNDESFSLLSSLASRDASLAWLAWTGALLKEHMEAPVAHYLYGDALARSGDWPGAKEAYDRSLALAPAFAMALNARGVAHAHCLNLAAAGADLKEACRLVPSFADAQASLGTRYMLSKTTEMAAKASLCYERALGVSSNFSLALNGKACALSALGSNTLAMEFFAKASSMPSIFPLTLQNFASAAAAILPPADGGNEGTNAPGMQVKSAITFVPQLQNIANNPSSLSRMSTPQLLQAYVAAKAINNGMGSMSRGWEAAKAGVGPINVTAGMTGGKTPTPMVSVSGSFDPSRAGATLNAFRSAAPALQNVQSHLASRGQMVVPNMSGNFKPNSFSVVSIPGPVQSTAIRAAQSTPGGVRTALPLATYSGQSDWNVQHLFGLVQGPLIAEVVSK